MNALSIGVFDSGVGGLSVLRAIRGLLPHEDLLYVADSGYAPYGERSEEFIMRRVQTVVEFMLFKGVKAIVVACNTATAVAVEWLRARLVMPVVAIEPAVKPAAALTRSGYIGVLATRRTLESESFLQLVNSYGNDVEVIPTPCPGFVEQVEKGELDGEETLELVTRCVEPLIQRGVDTLVLGCTHYPFLLPLIQQVAGPDVTVLEPSEAVARQLCRRLRESSLLSDRASLGAESFWTSGDPAEVTPIVSRLWGKEVRVQALPATLPARSEETRSAHSTPGRP